MLWPWLKGLYNSDVYAGDILLKNLKIFPHRHCSNLSLVGSQFISRNSLTPTWCLFLSLRQNLILAFLLTDLDFFDKTFVEVRIPRSTCVIKMWLYQGIA